MKTKLLSLAILLVLIFPTFRFFLTDKMFTFNDETQILNLHQYFRAMDLGQFPPRWAPDMHFEYGSPFLSFNYQLPYYLGYLGHLAHLPLTVIFKWLLVLSVVGGAFGMYFLGLVFTGSTFFALFAAVLYTYTPYQSIDHFVRGALGEVYALALFPWLFLAAYSLMRKTTSATICLLGFIFALLIISHQPAALFTLPLFSAIFIIPPLLQRNWKKIISFFKAFIISLLLSAYYWLPVILEKKFIQESSPFNYKDQFPFLWQLIYSPWSYQGANPFSSDTFSFQIGLVNLFILFVSLIFLFKKNKDKTESWLFRLTLLATFFSIFLMNIRSSFIWGSVPLMQSIQFPWRMLMFTTLFTPVLYLFMVRVWHTRFVKIGTLVLLILSITVNIGYFAPGLIVDRTDSYYERIFLPRSVLSPGETISADYLNFAEDYAPLPKGAVRAGTLPPAKLTSQNKGTIIAVSSANPFAYVAKVDNTVADVLTFHTFMYPGWQVVVDDYPGKITPNKIGAITFLLPPGKHTVRIEFADTPLRLFSNIISLGSLIFISLFFINSLRESHAPPTT